MTRVPLTETLLLAVHQKPGMSLNQLDTDMADLGLVKRWFSAGPRHVPASR